MRVALGRNGRFAARSALRKSPSCAITSVTGREGVGPAGADAVGQAAGRGVGGAHACDRRGPARVSASAPGCGRAARPADYDPGRRPRSSGDRATVS